MFVATSLAMLVAVTIPPWLALREAGQQAYRAEADLALGYANDIVRRADDTEKQALAGIGLLERSGHPPCSDASQALMRLIDLTSIYIQAVGHVEDGVLVCSSMGDDPVPLGSLAFRSSTGVTLHARVPLGNDVKSPLLGFQKGNFAALIHRDLPLDTWTAVPDVSLAMMHLEFSRNGKPVTHRGHVDPGWLPRLGDRNQVTVVTGGYLVALVRSRQFPTAGIAAVPVSYLDRRTGGLAWRFVPAGAIAGLALALAIFLVARQQLSLASAVRQGLRRNEFFLAYQPIVELATGRWVGVEALLRWRRSNGEMIGPDLFIPVAERTGTITKLTERVVELVHRDVGGFLAHHPAFHIALNLSAADLNSPRTKILLDKLLADAGAAPSNLIVEMTERALLNVSTAKPVIADLRAGGIEVAVDDFGTGYSSLSYLESFDVDFLKIDRAFTEAIGTRSPTDQVVHHIIAMAQTMQLRIIAEGVETEAQAEYLLARGVQFAQGWRFAKAMPWNEFRTAFEERGFGSPRVAANH
ncbi:EAL domain-containing protein [Pseudoduganella umbonata]|uniref:EAL domain-containing protein n=1 Tax=Pseudoduganella umbonata TaxID=864828 RepID=UPI001586362F|nr:EAL domain-containing protein [Pseudoduganella umbonata]